MRNNFLEEIVRSLDDRIVHDDQLNSALFRQLLDAQRELGLLHGDRPTCPFLRPLIVARSQYAAVARAAESIAVAFEKLADRALEDERLFAALGLTEAEARMARIDPGYSRLCPTSRLDAYFTDTGFKFLEYNAETPAGVGDQMQLEKVLFSLPHNEELLRVYEHWRPEPHTRLLTALLNTYREWSREERQPQIAIVDWEGVATESEFRILQRYFATKGVQSIIVDPNELHYDGQQLKAGDFRIDLVYKRVIIHEFLDRLNETHALARAYRDRRVCMVNSFRSKIVHKKAGFAILSDPSYQDLFDGEELETINRHIPWTRFVEHGKTLFDGAEYDLLSLIRKERERMVLKPNDDYGGHGVFLGWEMDQADWEKAIEGALAQQYVVQERVVLSRTPIPMFSDRVSLEEMFVDFNPYLFENEVEGALVRLSSSGLLNVTAGGGQTALLVLEGI
jgi:uncharacterized circularly permuted ATP-grasp superfamily protein